MSDSEARELFLFPRECQLASDGLSIVDGQGRALTEDQQVRTLELAVGELIALTAFLKHEDGSWERIDADRGTIPQLEVASSAYEVVAVGPHTLQLLGGQVTTEPAEVRVSWSARRRWWKRSPRLTLSLSVKVVRGKRLVLRRTQPLAGVPLAMLLYERHRFSAAFWKVNRGPYCYLVGPDGLSLRAKQELGQFYWAYSDNLAEGWHNISLSKVQATCEKAVSCSPLDEDGGFALTIGHKHGNNGMLVLQEDSSEYKVPLRLLADNASVPWAGFSESPRFLDKRSWKRAIWGRRIIGGASALIMISWICAGIMAQISHRGAVQGTLYSLYVLAGGALVLVFLIAGVFCLYAFMHSVSRPKKD